MGKFLDFKNRNGWEYVERKNCDGVVAVIAITNNHQLVLVEQYRPAIDARSLELPAGLMDKDEAGAVAAIRELHEETGYVAHSIKYMHTVSSSAGLTSELIDVYLCTFLHHDNKGGGIDGEDIAVHVIDVNRLDKFIAEREDSGCIVDSKVHHAVLYAQSGDYC